MPVLNRIIEIQRPQVAFRGGPTTWVRVAEVWAELVSVRPRERYSQGAHRRVNETLTRYRILARADVDELMRILDDYGRSWDIVGIIKNGRQYIELQVQHSA